ncbi:MAG: ATP-binding protein [Myxococcales bacterium]
MIRRIERDFAATLDQVSDACDVLREFCEGHGVSEDQSYPLVLALEELGANVVNHGYRGRADGRFEVHMTCLDNALELEVIDAAPAFNPLEAPPPDLDASIEDRPIGGLGVHLVRQLTEQIEYRRTQGHNHVIVRLPLP